MQDLFDRYGAAWAAHDPDAIVALHSDDTSFQLHAGQERAEGKDAVREAFAALFDQFPDLGFEQRSLHLGPAHWTVEWRVTGTAENGAVMNADMIDVITVRDGLVHTKDSYIDSVTVLAQLSAEVAV